MFGLAAWFLINEFRFGLKQQNLFASQASLGQYEYSSGQPACCPDNKREALIYRYKNYSKN
jgi:hypothetical protein